jgi:hypothetical protein
MLKHQLLSKVVAVSLLTLASLQNAAAQRPAAAEEPGKIDLEAAELESASLVSWPVIAGGHEIGTVHDVTIGAGGRIEAIRVRTPWSLGLGERIVEIPTPAFTVLRDAVVLDLTAEEVDQLPSAPNEDRPENTPEK